MCKQRRADWASAIEVSRRHKIQKTASKVRKKWNAQVEMYKRWIKRQPAEHKPISCERKTERETSRANKSENLPKTEKITEKV